jgi:hypothetical protein
MIDTVCISRLISAEQAAYKRGGKMKSQIIDPQASYTFSDYFKLNADVEEILAYFGYLFQIQTCPLPQTTLDPTIASNLSSSISELLPYLSLTSEIARREFLIAPILSKVAVYTQVKIKSEYHLAVNEQLKGTLDYYLRGKSNLLVIEAKNADPQRGFTQLAVELVALDQWLDIDTKVLYGALSMGDIWRFGVLDRQTKQVTQDINLFRVPADLDELLNILVAILNG